VCGLAGEIRYGGRADLDAVERMAASMSDRGPDGDGSFLEGGVALAHRRLKIIDLSERGRQPMVDEELRLAVVFNGCIYNHRELRAELEAEGYRFFSDSDTEVLLKAYHCFGEDFPKRLHGMFALALTELDTGRVVLARDRLGIKPLYLAEGPGRTRFASTLQALIAGGEVDTSIDPVALHHYMTWHAVVPPPHTILAGVRKLPPATVMVLEADGRRRDHTYWSPDFERQPGHEDMEADDWTTAVMHALHAAVERRMVSDVPVGVLLSGGLDSSLIVALLAGTGQQCLQTFSIGFEDVGGREGDEFAYSDLVAREFGTEHHKLEVTSERMLPALEGAVAAMSEPMVSHDAVAFFLLAEQVSKQVKVVQSGQGADEAFAGYHWYQPVAQADGKAFEEYAGRFFDRSHREVALAVQPQHRAPHDVSREFAAAHFGREGADEPVDRALRLDTEVMLVDDPVKRVDNMTMAWGLEARVPFLDHELIELAAACPPELKLGQGGKGVLKDVGRRLLPDEVVDRPKGYFPVPALSHLEGDYLDLVREALLAPEARERGIFERSEVQRLLDEPNDHMTPLDGNKLWQLGLLELWLQKLGA
jgi:asparagine synthase (glutamine-hydrolysing)